MSLPVSPAAGVLLVPLAAAALLALLPGHRVPARLNVAASALSLLAAALLVADRPEAEELCAFIRGEREAAAILERFRDAASPGFDPDRDLRKIGLANQTTMLMTESLEIQEMLRRAMAERWGEAELPGRAQVQALVDGKTIVKCIFVPGRLLNLVVK